MTSETQPTQTIEQIDWQIDFIESLQRLNDGLQAIRSNIRPTDQIQNLLQQPGIGDELRSLWSLLKELDTSFKLLPSVINKADDRIDQIRQITSGADAITRMIRMFEQADTATAATQVTDMSYLFKDVQALLPALKYLIEGFKLNPVIGAYLTVLGMALEQIAISIGQIEEAARIRNDLITSERDLALGRDPAPTSTTPAEDPGLQQALDALKRQREELLAQMDRAAMTDVTNARDLAYREHGVTQADVDAREHSLEESWRALRDAWEHRQVLEGQKLNLPSALIEAEVRLETVQLRRRRGAASEDEVTAALRTVDDLTKEQTRVAEAIRRADEALRTAYQEFTRARALVQPILDSIRRTLTRYGRNQEWFRRYLPSYMDPNYWSLPAMRRIEAHLKVPSTVASADTGLANPFGNPLMLVAALGLVAIVALAGFIMLSPGGGDDDAVAGALLSGDAASTLTVSPTVADPTPTSAIAMGTPVLSASSIVATFYPDTFTTEYRVEAFSTLDGDISYTWSGADCGESGTDSETPNIFEWYHPHPPCDGTTDHSDRTIVVLITSGGETWRCEYQGSHTGSGDACQPQ